MFGFENFEEKCERKKQSLNKVDITIYTLFFRLSLYHCTSPLASKSKMIKKKEQSLNIPFITRIGLEMKDHLNPIWPCNLRIVFFFKMFKNSRQTKSFCK